MTRLLQRKTQKNAHPDFAAVIDKIFLCDGELKAPNEYSREWDANQRSSSALPLSRPRWRPWFVGCMSILARQFSLGNRDLACQRKWKRRSFPFWLQVRGRCLMTRTVASLAKPLSLPSSRLSRDDPRARDLEYAGPRFPVALQNIPQFEVH